MVDKINSNPNAPYRAALNPKWANLTRGQVRRFLSPLKNQMKGRASAHPIGGNSEKFAQFDKKCFTGYHNPRADVYLKDEQKPGEAVESFWNSTHHYKYVVFDNSRLCSSWSPAVTSAMSLAMTIQHKRFVNLSLQYVIDCDLLGDPCISRPPLDAYRPFLHDFHATGLRGVPQANFWPGWSGDPVDDPLRVPNSGLTPERCAGGQPDLRDNCYPGYENCPRNNVLTGNCDAGTDGTNCPVYFLGDWRWMKSHLWEVGPVTSTIVVRPSFFTYNGTGVYTSTKWGDSGEAIDFDGEPLGLLDVTIIGWGQDADVGQDTDAPCKRWWYVIPHLGWDFGATCQDIFVGEDGTPLNVDCGNVPGTPFSPGSPSGIMRINRRFDDCGIESQSVGAVPYNFQPLKWVPG